MPVTSLLRYEQAHSSLLVNRLRQIKDKLSSVVVHLKPNSQNAWVPTRLPFLKVPSGQVLWGPLGQEIPACRLADSTAGAWNAGVRHGRRTPPVGALPQNEGWPFIERQCQPQPFEKRVRRQQWPLQVPLWKTVHQQPDVLPGVPQSVEGKSKLTPGK